MKAALKIALDALEKEQGHPVTGMQKRCIELGYRAGYEDKADEVQPLICRIERIEVFEPLPAGR